MACLQAGIVLLLDSLCVTNKSMLIGLVETNCINLLNVGTTQPLKTDVATLHKGSIVCFKKFYMRNKKNYRFS
jgi:hypothetical protein